MTLRFFSSSKWTLAIAALFTLAPGPARFMQAGELSDDVRAGLAIYRDGVLPDGTPLQAERPGIGRVTGRAAACESCHRRSGLGSQEGRLLVPPVAASILFAPGQPYHPQRPGRAKAAATPKPLRHQARSAYDHALLGRALQDGIDPDGAPLTTLMPRYRLSDAQLRQLAAYLQTLDTAAPAGVEGRTLHLATILTPDAPAERRATLLRTLQGWQPGATLRGLRPRLHVWALSGPPDSWPDQLERWQRERPVYAVLSGAGRDQWEPVQRFCERAQLPCLLPLLDRIPPTEGQFYSLYFSSGLDGELKLLQRHLDTLIQRDAALQLLQVHLPQDSLSHHAAASFQQGWTESQGTEGASHLGNLDWTDPTALPDWTAGSASAPASAGTSPRHIVALWLRPAQLQRLVQHWPDGWPGAEAVLLSAQLTPPEQVELPPAWQAQVRWASMHSDPARLRASRAMVLNQWLRRLGLTEEPGTSQAETYAAIFFLGDAMARMRLGWSQAYLLEELERSITLYRPAGAVYFSASLGPNQRIAAKGGHVLRFRAPAAGDPPLLPALDRLVPAGPLVSVDE